MILGLLILFAVVIIGTLYFITRSARVSFPDFIVFTSETRWTVVLGILLWLETLVFMLLAYFYPERVFTFDNAYINISIFFLVGIFLGSYCLLLALVHKFIATESGLISIDSLGRQKKIKWNEIVDIQRKGTLKLKFISKTTSITIHGEKKRTQRFIEEIERKIDKRMLQKVLNRSQGFLG